MGMMGGGAGMQPMMEKEMQAEGISQKEQQEMMRQMNKAMQQMQKQQPKK
jgi:truncated hemoglobin YjbI